MVLTELHHRGHNHMDTDLLSKFEHRIVSSSRNVKVVLSLRLTDCHCAVMFPQTGFIHFDNQKYLKQENARAPRNKTQMDVGQGGGNIQIHPSF